MQYVKAVKFRTRIFHKNNLYKNTEAEKGKNSVNNIRKNIFEKLSSRPRLGEKCAIL